MKKWLKFEIGLVVFAIIICITESCNDKVQANEGDTALTNENYKEGDKKELSKDFKDYWYAGDAEITSYRLEQARYGEVREGHSVLIYVTEPFLADKQVKADNSSPKNVPVLKLNATKKYLTGIYPYSIMTSTFYPVHDHQHAFKVSCSVQEWCGQVYMQLNNREQFEVMSHSYFESEGDQDLKMEKAILENELWNKIRIAPDDLPTGDIQIIPSLEYIRTGHKEIKAYNATASLSGNGELKSYTINYPELERTLTINFTATFPFSIEGWEDSFKSGFGTKAKILTSKATKIKTLKTPYWQQNGNKDVILRDSLGI